MTEPTVFRWHDAARLYAGERQIAQPGRAADTAAYTAAHTAAKLGFRAISATPTPHALRALGAQLGGGFCIFPGGAVPPPACAPQDFVTLTGGSSGAPKAVLRSQASWTRSFAVNAGMFGLGPGSRVAVLGRMDHSLALYGVMEGLHLGCEVYALDALPPGAQATACRDRQVQVLYATPTQLRLLASGARARALPALRLVLCGGGALDTPTRAALAKIAPQAELRVFYGAAETSFITLSDADTPEGSVGRAYPGVDLRIDSGEVWLRSPYLFERYVSGASTDTRWRDGWLSVGELGRIDGHGNLWLSGRKTRMVTIADQNVFPEEVERFIAQTLGRTNAVVACADAMRGHRLVALLEGPQDDNLAERVKGICREQFGALVAPRRVLFCDSLPRLASGKLNLAALVKLAEETT